VVAPRADDTSDDDITSLQEGSRLEAGFPAMFPDSVTPPGCGMTAGAWLTHVAGIAGAMSAPLQAFRRHDG
jgi:hypothetical protein